MGFPGRICGAVASGCATGAVDSSTVPSALRMVGGASSTSGGPSALGTAADSSTVSSCGSSVRAICSREAGIF